MQRCFLLLCVACCLWYRAEANLRSDDDQDLLEHQELIRTQTLDEKEHGTTQVNPETMKPFPQRPWNPKTVTSVHRSLFNTALLQLQQELHEKGDISEVTDLSSLEDDFLSEELREAIRLSLLSDADVQLALEIFKVMDTEGNPIASYHLGLLYQRGKLVQRDFKYAFELIQRAAKAGYPPAQRELGFMYDTGKGTSSDSAKALIYYTIAAKGGDIEAALVLANKYANGYDVVKSCATAAVHYKEVAQTVTEKIIADGYDNSGYVNFVDLMEYEETGELPHQQEEDVVEYMEFAAANGDPIYQVQIGLMNLFGVYGHKIDYNEARMYFEAAYQAQDPDVSPRAAALLGSLYEDGHGVEQSNETALEYYQIAYDQGTPHGAYRLGRAYLRGTGVDQNYELALEYLKKAADEMHVAATTELAKMYYHGIGVQFDYTKAVMLFNTAAVHDDAEAKFYFARMNHYGLGTPERCTTALSWYQSVAVKGEWVYEFDTALNEYLEENYDTALLIYEKLAARGFKMALFNVAWMYDNQLYSDSYLEPGEDSTTKAFEYYKMAADKGIEHAHLRLGDYYFTGLGNASSVSIPLAIAHYRSISKTNARSLYNLGYIHQHGIGVAADRHVANEFYTAAMNLNDEAVLACLLSIASLGIDYVVEKYHNNALGEVLPALWDYLWYPSVFTEFTEALQRDLEELERELEQELQELEENSKSSASDSQSEYSFLDEDIGGYSLDSILIALLCVTIGILLLFRNGFVQIEVQRI